MLLKISLIVAMCSGTSMATIQKTVKELESKNPGAKVTLHLDRKASCDAKGNLIPKTKSE